MKSEGLGLIFPARCLAKDIPVPAAIGYDTKRNRLLIPQIALSSVTMVDLP